jgi:hypothetical protein
MSLMITKKGIKKELQLRAIDEARKTPILLRDDFPEQKAFIEDTSKFIAAQCSRRAGKSNGLAIRFLRTMDKHPRSHCLYLSLTQDSARSIMWPILQELNELHNLGCTFVESKMKMYYPNGSTLQLMGADLKNFVKRLKGRKHPGIAIDESQDFGAHIQSLIDDVLTPSIADYEDGWLALTGTPGPVPQGMFFDITQNGKYGYSVHKWDLTQNPYMPDASGFLRDLIKRREWLPSNPTLLREYRNQWVLDVESLWVRYNEERNNYAKLPPGKLNYVLGVDIGYRDADALAVLGWSDVSKETYLVEEIITKRQDISGLVEQIEQVRARYDITKIVMDTGGLGKKIHEEITRRHAIPIFPADKMRKQENVELLNDNLRLGLFKAKADSRFVMDSYQVQIDWDKSTPDRIVIKKNPHSDIIDAVLYAYKETQAFYYEPPVHKLVYGTKAWADAQSLEMFEKELNGFKQEEHYNDILNGVIKDE